MGDVARLDVIGGYCREVALEQVRSNEQLMFAVGGDNELSLALGLDAVLLHDAPHALLADTDTASHQFFPHLGPAVSLLNLDVSSPDMNQ